MATARQLLAATIFLQIANAYHLTLSYMEYPRARAYCQDYCHSELASIHSQADQDEIVELITRDGYATREVWIGLHDSEQENTWQWDDGSPFNFGNTSDDEGFIVRGRYPWRSKEPDPDSEDNHIAIEATRNYEWIDRRSTYNYHVLCDSCSGQIERYVAINGYREYDEAEQECEDTFGTSLASIASIWDMHEAQSHCQGVAFNRTGIGCWIGLQNEGSIYRWTDGLDWIFGDDIHSYPWSIGGGRSAGSGDCVLMDPSDEYYWRQTPCSKDARTLCNKPSEVCKESQWFTIPQDANWTTTKKPCAMLSDFTSGYSGMTLIGDRQFVNWNGMLKVDMTFSIEKSGVNGNTGMVLFLDTQQCSGYYYIGVSKDSNILFFGKFVDDQWTLIDQVALMAGFVFGAHYSLQVELYQGFEWTISLNSQLLMDNVTDDSFDHRGSIVSGHLGIRNVNSSLSVDSFFVSGDIQFEDDLDFYYECYTRSPTTDPTLNPSFPPTTDPTAFPTRSPSVSPTTDPTLNPSAFPTSDPTRDPTMEPTLGFDPLDLEQDPVGNFTSIRFEGNRHEWWWYSALSLILVAILVVLLSLVMSVRYCCRQWTLRKFGDPDGYDGGVVGKGANQRKQTTDQSNSDDDDDGDGDEEAENEDEDIVYEDEANQLNVDVEV